MGRRSESPSASDRGSIAWRWIHSCIVLTIVMSLLPLHAKGLPVTVDFTVTGTTGPLTGQVSAGSFSFDGSLIPAGFTGFLRDEAGFGVSSFSFDWAGTHWGTDNADLYYLHSTNGTLDFWEIGGAPFGFNGVSATLGVGDFLALGGTTRRGSLDYAVAGYPLLAEGTLDWVFAALEAAVSVEPGVINLASHAPWLTAYIEPSGFDPVDIDLSTVRLAGSVPASAKFAARDDHNSNDVPDLMVKFSREALEPLLVPGLNVLELTGTLVTGEEFEGQCEVRVIAHSGAALGASVAPNPMNPFGVLHFQTSRSGPARVTLFDIHGRMVRLLMDAPALREGAHAVPVDGRGDTGCALATGVYFYRIEAVEGQATGRVTILK